VQPTQLAFGGGLVALLAALAGYFGWQQVRQLRRLRGAATMPAEEHTYQRRRAWRRLFGCLLMAVLAGLFVGMFFLEGPAQQLADAQMAAADAGEEFQPDEAQKQFGLFYRWYWIVLLLALLALLATAVVDLLATRRFSLRQYRRLQADRRAMVERQVARLRQERNGPSP